MLPSLIAAVAAIAVAAPRDTLRVLLVTGDTLAPAGIARGATLGAEEAARTGALFGTPVVLRVALAGDSAAAARAVDATFAGARPSLIVAGDAAPAACTALARASARLEIALLDGGCTLPDSLRGATVFSLFPAADPVRGPADSTRLELWHWSLERFGGEQLNQRYERRFAEHMSSRAWAGWLAAKIALDLALRSHSVRASALLARLRDPAAQFDGQKGRPLFFSREQRRLVQPLYRVSGAGTSERVVAEVNP